MHHAVAERGGMGKVKVKAMKDFKRGVDRGIQHSSNRYEKGGGRRGLRTSRTITDTVNH